MTTVWVLTFRQNGGCAVNGVFSDFEVAKQRMGLFTADGLEWDRWQRYGTADWYWVQTAGGGTWELEQFEVFSGEPPKESEGAD